jgi:hypothetical protein
MLRALLLFAALEAPSLLGQTIFLSDLENEDAACFSTRPSAGCGGWMGIHDAAITLSRGEIVHSGSKSLKIQFVKNEDYGGTYRTVSARRVFTRFYDFYDSGFDFAAGMKIQRFSAFNSSKQVNDFDIILQSKADEPNYNLCGLTDAKYLALSFNGGPHDWGSVEARFTFQRGRWYCVETEINLNKPGASDGEVRIWVDGHLVAEKKSMDLSGSLSSPINRIMFGGWYSSSAAGRNPCPNPVNASRRYVDDVAISGSYIGPIPQVAAGPSPLSRIVSVTLPQAGTMQVEWGLTAAYGALTPAVVSTGGIYALPVLGLDTNKTYHARLRGTINGMGAYLSPDFTFSTRPGGLLPPPSHPPRRPVNLKSRDYDPIPD